MRGRKPKPPQLRLVGGNAGKRPIRRSPQPKGVAARPPGLSPAARREWDRLKPPLAALGLLTPADAQFFACYCEAAATWRHANQQLRKLGEMVLDDKGMPCRNPWLRVRSDAAAELRQFGSEF